MGHHQPCKYNREKFRNKIWKNCSYYGTFLAAPCILCLIVYRLSLLLCDWLQAAAAADVCTERNKRTVWRTDYQSANHGRLQGTP